jgi:hypothetical protein
MQATRPNRAVVRTVTMASDISDVQKLPRPSAMAIESSSLEARRAFLDQAYASPSVVINISVHAAPSRLFSALA